LNGGPHFKINEAISFVVNCKSQAEVNYYWKKLTDGGKEVQCGWLQDKFGVSWQIVPTALGELINSEDAAKSQRVMAAMLQMVKLDIKKLKQAAKGK
jgi:predicted 3-demethylubiquinone-9 3-methyltransferase (glyoxalase superfamily)